MQLRPDGDRGACHFPVALGCSQKPASRGAGLTRTATAAVRTLAQLYGASSPKAVKGINDGGSTFATVRLRTKVTRGADSRTAALTMVLKLVESARARWRDHERAPPRRTSQNPRGMGDRNRSAVHHP